MTHVICHVSHVRCLVSGVTCQVSHVTSNSLTVRAMELKFWEKFTSSHMSPVICHVSWVTCHMSHVTISFFTKWLSYLVEGLLSMGPTSSSCRTAPATTGLVKITSLLRRLQAQTLPDAAPPIGKIHPFSKMAATCEAMMRFGCPNSLWIYMTLLSVS